MTDADFFPIKYFLDIFTSGDDIIMQRDLRRVIILIITKSVQEVKAHFILKEKP